MKNWLEISQSFFDTLGYSPRDQQSLLGQSIIDTIESNGHLIAEAPTGVGKSLSALIPLLTKMTEDSEYRALIITPTKNLQKQYIEDIESLKTKISYSSLMGKENYICHAQFRSNKSKIDDYVFERISKMIPKLKEGSRAEIEENLNMRLSDNEWKLMSGQSQRCSDSSCAPENCFGTKAVRVARESQLVITNSAMFRVDVDMRLDDPEEGYLGKRDCIICDEAHLLEQDYISGSSTDLSEWEINDNINRINKGIQSAANVFSMSPTVTTTTEESLVDFQSLLYKIKDFYLERESGSRGECVIKENFIPTNSPIDLQNKMLDYEEHLFILDDIIPALQTIDRNLDDGLQAAIDSHAKGVAKTIRKGKTSVHTMKSLAHTLKKAFSSKNGTFVDFDVPKNVVFRFYPSTKDRSIKSVFSIVPLDISSQLAPIWDNRATVLMSATLRDIATDDFSYVKTSLGYPEYSQELVLQSVFDLSQQQVFYLTDASETKVDLPGAQFSYEELRSLLEASKGRSLVLFTAMKELEYVRDKLIIDPLPYPMYFQTNGENKDYLTQKFKDEEDSILFASRSYFQGVNFPGPTLSQVILCKFPLLGYNDLTMNQERWWKGRGFPKWYNSQSMFSFQQAVGRGIRSSSDKVIVSILDQRITSPHSRVCQMTKKAIEYMGSGAMTDKNYVEMFLRA